MDCGCCLGPKTNMLTAMPVLPSERSDFRNLVQRLGHEETDFVIVVESEDPVPAGAVTYPEHGTVTIRCVKTQVERAYRTGMGTHWVADFEQDFRENKFR